MNIICSILRYLKIRISKLSCLKLELMGGSIFKLIRTTFTILFVAGILYLFLYGFDSLLIFGTEVDNTLHGIVIGAILSFILTLTIEREKKNREFLEQLLKNIYLPLWREIDSCGTLLQEKIPKKIVVNTSSSSDNPEVLYLNIKNIKDYKYYPFIRKVFKTEVKYITECCEVYNKNIKNILSLIEDSIFEKMEQKLIEKNIINEKLFIIEKLDKLSMELLNGTITDRLSVNDIFIDSCGNEKPSLETKTKNDITFVEILYEIEVEIKNMKEVKKFVAEKKHLCSEFKQFEKMLNYYCGKIVKHIH